MLANPFWPIWIVAALRNARSIFRREVLNVFALCTLLGTKDRRSRGRSNILGRLTRGDRFHSHGEERTQEQNSRAPKLSVSEPFVKDPSGERHRSGGTKQLEGLRERDSDLVYRHIIQNVGERNTGHSGND